MSETVEQYFTRRGYTPLTKRYMMGYVLDHRKGTRISAIVKDKWLVLAVYRYLTYDRSDRQRHQSVFGHADKWILLTTPERKVENLGHEINVLTCKANTDLQVKTRAWLTRREQEQHELARFSRSTGRRLKQWNPSKP